MPQHGVEGTLFSGGLRHLSPCLMDPKCEMIVVASLVEPCSSDKVNGIILDQT